MTPVLDPRAAREIWAPYVDDIALACLSRRPAQQTARLVAIGLRESLLGTSSDFAVSPGDLPWMGRGDMGHGRGLFQIDDRGPFAHLIPPSGEAWPPFVQACSALAVLEDAERSLASWADDPLYERAVVAAYNCGTGNAVRALRARKDPDFWTTGRNYGRDVLELRDLLCALYSTVFPPMPDLVPQPA